MRPTPRAHKGGLPDSHGVRLAVPLPDGTETRDLKTAAAAWGTSGRTLLAAIYNLMMGFPPGWLSEPDQPSETASIPLSRSPSPAP